MAHTPSIIFTKEERKAKITELNESISTVKSDLKITAAKVKENDLKLKVATKEHANAAKALEKQAAKYAKDLETFENQKAALTATPAASVSMLATPVKRHRRTKAEMEEARAAAAAAAQ